MSLFALTTHSKTACSATQRFASLPQPTPSRAVSVRGYCRNMIPTRLPSIQPCHYPLQTPAADPRLSMAAFSASSASQRAAAAQPKPFGAGNVGMALSPYMAQVFMQAGGFTRFAVAPPSWNEQIVNLRARGVPTAIGPSLPMRTVQSHPATLRPAGMQAPGQPAGGAPTLAGSHGGMTMAKPLPCGRFLTASGFVGDGGCLPWGLSSAATPQITLVRAC